jgi:glycosyltransferase involved in cell wall biosynthesis
MHISFDGRVLKHKIYTGVENYTNNIFNTLKEKISITVLEPKSSNKYLEHLWTHIKLPFLATANDLLFSPISLAPLFFFRKTKLVMTVHDIAFITYSKSVTSFFYLYYSFLIPKNIKRANQIITISEASKQEILNVFPYAKGKITVIHLGVDKKYRILKNIKKEKQILFVGSINERKNLKGVIKSFNLLPLSLEYKLVIVGDFFNNFFISSELENILDKAKKNKKIIFKNRLTDTELIYEYNISSCFIFPSFYEGFGLPPLEAMACGTPVITSSVSSMPEVCKDAALYVNPYDINDMSKKLQILLLDTSLQYKLIQKGLKHVKQFSWEKSAQEHIKVFEKVLSDQ